MNYKFINLDVSIHSTIYFYYDQGHLRKFVEKGLSPRLEAQ